MSRHILVCNWRDRLNPDAGGAEVNIHNVFRRMVDRGDRVTLLCSRRDRTRPAEEMVDGIRVLRRGNNWTFNLTVPRVLLTELRHEAFDLIVEDITKIPFYTPLYSSVPVLVRMHHVHGMSVREDFGLPTALYVSAMERLIPYLYGRAPFVVVSEGTKTDLARIGMPRDRMSVIYNGLDHGLYVPATKTPAEDAPLVLFVGRLRKYKGAAELLDAIHVVSNDVPNVRVAIVGTGEEELALREQAGRLQMEDRVEFRGYVDGEEKVRLMQRACVLVNPSRKEGWGLTVLEANACGTPAIGADGPGLNEAIQHERTGLLYPPGDVRTLASQITRLVTDDKERARMSGEALAWAAEFSWDRAVREHTELIDRMLAKESIAGGAFA